MVLPRDTGTPPMPVGDPARLSAAATNLAAEEPHDTAARRSAVVGVSIARAWICSLLPEHTTGKQRSRGGSKPAGPVQLPGE